MIVVIVVVLFATFRPNLVRVNQDILRLFHAVRHGTEALVYGNYLREAAASIVGALKSIYEMKCALLDKIVNFGTQIVEIFLYRNFDGSKLVSPVFGRHLGFLKWPSYGTYIQQYLEKEDT